MAQNQALTPMTLSDLVIAIHQRETGAPLSDAQIHELRELADEYGVDTDPRWLLPLFTAIQRGEAVPTPVFFERAGSDPHSYLFELALTLRWKSEHQGEYDEIELPKLGWRIYLSHEARSPTTGRGGSNYTVTRL